MIKLGLATVFLHATTSADPKETFPTIKGKIPPFLAKPHISGEAILIMADFEWVYGCIRLRHCSSVEATVLLLDASNPADSKEAFSTITAVS
ncbi:hypothetical protein BaRGS_00037274 [Batillaria attramentaria]|uniref:Uncharacterized protein n=1 Tax=Batillaria attramentaria TaxID=370345 RepID=A0ABD0J9A1_9CAEN